MWPMLLRPGQLPGGVSQRTGARRAVRQAAVRRVRGQALRGAGPGAGAGLLQDDARGGVAVGAQGAGPQHRAQAAHAPRQSLFQNIFCECPHIFVPRLHRRCRPLVRRARCAARWCGWWRAWSGARPCSASSGCGCWPGTTPSGGTKPTTPAGRSTSNHILTRGSGYNF